MHLLRRREAISTDVVFGASYNQKHSIRGLRLLAVGSALIILTASASAVALSRTNSPIPSTPTVATDRIQDLTTRTTPVANVTLIPNCTQGTYSLPTSIDPTNLSDGIHYQIDSPLSYKIYGDSTAAIGQQMYDCTPVVEGSRFAANTGFNLSSYYTYGVNSDGTCSVTRATVSLHINQIYPEWVDNGADTATVSTWNRFITNLRTHENGHVNFDKRYAQKLYDQLKAISGINCGGINATAQVTIKSVVTELQSANDGYDAATNHGETQGATL